MRVRLCIAAVLSLIASLVTLASPASATPRSGTTAGGSTHCVLHGTAVSRNQSAAASKTTYKCFSTFAAAVREATGGTVNLPPSATRVTERDLAKAASSRSMAVATSTLIGIEYKDTNLNGATLHMSSSGPCTSSTYTAFPSMNAYGWNNTIGSAVTYSGCKAAHYQYDNYGGPSIVCNCYSNLGALNDLTSSIWFSTTGR